MKILVINSGSSSLKYQLFDMDKHVVLAKGECERIGAGGEITHKVPGKEKVNYEKDFPSHDVALKETFKLLTDKDYGVLNDTSEITAIGHRIAHGAEKYKTSTIATKEMIEFLESIVPINPLHGPAGIKGIKAAMELLPSVPNVAVFDTAFYTTVKEENYIYGLPYEFYENDKIRRYGFHGTSHRYVSMKAAEFLGLDYNNCKIITCHIGNGSSITATKNGEAVDTSMGFTPQEGILMGTRTGTIDPTVIPFIMEKYNYSPKEMSDIMNKKSGLLGISGLSNDCRNLFEAKHNGNKRASLALDILKMGLKKYIGMYTAEMNGLDVLVFTAGIGEHRSELREMVLDNMDYLGIKYDKELNNQAVNGEIMEISTSDSKVKVLVVPTNEEYMIALDTINLIKGE